MDNESKLKKEEMFLIIPDNGQRPMSYGELLKDDGYTKAMYHGNKELFLNRNQNKKVL